MRIFVGIPIPSTLQEQIAKECRALPALSDLYGNPEVRWIAGKYLHITLVPPWDEVDVDAVVGRLSRVVLPASFEIAFTQVSGGPSPSSTRLVWATGAAPAQLINLQRQIYKALGREPEKRVLKMHATLARFKNPQQFTDSFPVYWTMKVKGFTVYQSRLLSSGAEYTILRSFVEN